MRIIIDKDCFFILQEILIDPKYRMDKVIIKDYYTSSNITAWYESCYEYNNVLYIDYEELVEGKYGDYWGTNTLLPKLAKLADSDVFFLALGMELYRRCPNSLIDLSGTIRYDEFYWCVECWVNYGKLYLNHTEEEEFDRVFNNEDVIIDETIDWDAICGFETTYIIQLKNGRFIKDVKDYKIRYKYTEKRVNSYLEEMNNEIEEKGFDSLNQYIDQENKNLSHTGIDVQSEFDKAVSDDIIRSYIQVKFFDDEKRTYNYLCTGEVKVGDKVFGVGAMRNVIGTVKAISTYWPRGIAESVSYMAKNEDELLALAKGDKNDEPWEYEINKNGHIIITQCNLMDSDIVIPAVIDGKNVTVIGQYAFANNRRIRTVVIPDGVKSIRAGAFAGCTEMTSISIPDSVLGIHSTCSYDEGPFYNCRSLTSIRLPKNLETIDDLTFEKCSGLTSVIIPDSVKQIRNGAFMGCSELTYFELPNEDVEFRAAVFAGCDKLKCLTTRDGKELQVPGGMLCI